ncbi:DUF6221 family protein [Actinomadura hibisca]|uniref:DUF6221 family protein n=1 Tax=Actinomadura hibisca TaxID=68565 RepID=UPI000829CA02|nr:DUF6221 family protein [Actinomadura hibisca]
MSGWDRPPPPTGETRIGVFYDGGWFHHLSSYFANHSTWRSGLALQGVHDMLRWYLAQKTGRPLDGIVITQKHFVRGRRGDAPNPFDAVLDNEGVMRHDVTVNAAQEKGADVHLALETFQQAVTAPLDVVALITGDADFVPLVERLHRFEVKVLLPTIDVTFFDANGKRWDLACSSALAAAADHTPTWTELIGDALRPGYVLAYPLMSAAPSGDPGDGVGQDGYRRGTVNRWDPGQEYGFVQDDLKRSWFVSRGQLVGGRTELEKGQRVAFLGEFVRPEGKSHPPALGVRPIEPGTEDGPVREKDPVEFLYERLAEEESLARAAQSGEDFAAGVHRLVPDADAGLMAFLGRQDPARVLADIAARTEIIRLHTSGEGEALDSGRTTVGIGRCPICDEADHPCTTVRLLASVYENHPDYRQEWGA